MAGINEILRPITLTKVISRQAATSTLLLSRFGMQKGGKNESYQGHGREGSYHVYNHTRKIAAGRAPGTAAGRSARNPIARVPFTYPRMHDSVPLLAEELHNLAKIDDPRMRDEAGADYIARQTKTLAEKAGNWRTALLVGMLRDSLYIQQSGDNWYPSYTSSGALFQIPFQMPSGNTAQLAMIAADGNIIDIPWSHPAANIPQHLSLINRGFQRLNGGRLGLAILGSKTWTQIINNDAVGSIAGIANPPFKTYERQVATGPDGTPVNAYIGALNCAPGVEFFITDEVLDVGAPGSETTTSHVPDDHVFFLVSPDEGDFTMMLGSEPIAERDGGPKTVKVGLQAWSNESANPTSTNIFALDNALPVPTVPSMMCNAAVSGF